MSGIDLLLIADLIRARQVTEIKFCNFLDAVCRSRVANSRDCVLVQLQLEK